MDVTINPGIGVEEIGGLGEVSSVSKEIGSVEVC